jgi:hypothetical protein
MLRQSADDPGKIIGIFAGPVMLVVILIAWAFGLGKNDPSKWYGKMTCSKCGYLWESRRDTPPGRCPHCSSNRIETRLG